jgi:hypothetical protein
MSLLLVCERGAVTREEGRDSQADSRDPQPRFTATGARDAIPEGITRDWVRSLFGFGVGVAIGVAPLLGRLPVPGFTALLSLFPVTMQTWLIPLSAFLMGISSVAITFYSRLSPSLDQLRKYFTRTLVISLCCFLILLIVYVLSVVHVDIPALRNEVAFVVGFGKCSQCAGLSDAACVGRLTLNPAAITSCYGDRAIAINTLLLSTSYLALLSCFGVMVGLFNMSQARKRRRQRALS